MLELNVTHMIQDADEMPLLSGSVAELGNSAGRLTWNNSLVYSYQRPLLSTPDEIKEARDYFAEFGAWSREEIDAWTDAEVQAITVQEVAARIREMEEFESFEDYEEASYQGRVSGMLYPGDDGQWYASLSH